jgi:hypothetical protein
MLKIFNRILNFTTGLWDEVSEHPIYPFFGTGFLVFVFAFYYFFISAPSYFPVGSLVTVKEGATLTDISFFSGF